MNFPCTCPSCKAIAQRPIPTFLEYRPFEEIQKRALEQFTTTYEALIAKMYLATALDKSCLDTLTGPPTFDETPWIDF